MTLNTETFKKPQTWAIIVPGVLLLWTVIAAGGMLSAGEQAEKSLKVAKEARLHAGRILALESELGGPAATGSSSRALEETGWAVRCAFEAGVPVAKFFQAASARPLGQKDGSKLNHETYKIKGVGIVQIVKFVHSAERNYPSLNCTELVITRARSNVKDFWDATADLKYLTE